ncbi:hypothetical protein BS47DRAFT_1336615 [Hydnum rufescens UP504]|uniref:Cytokinin riboside 5'-monophosphate phosphoribohydrolase n=1 Tax=Hydnum rufescens UP504 TaxID=1448309 RepID=A0A9P6DZU8_9AGAM|nr:hypothetical protein BS47DRAFT_1336615 [Hydnum rufescens UP504]
MSSKAACVFCGSSVGTNPEFVRAAKCAVCSLVAGWLVLHWITDRLKLALGRAFALQGRTLIYGGGDNGLMGAVSSECLEAGSRTIGIVPHAIAQGGGEGDTLHKPIEANENTIITASMHERKAKMASLAEGGFFGLPGGFGTFEEVLEAITWTQIGIHKKPVVLLNVCGYYTPLKQLIESGVTSGFITPWYSRIVVFVEAPEREGEGEGEGEAFDWGKAALEALETWKMPECGALFKDWVL